MAGTPFENQILDYSKFVLRAGQWATYKEPGPVEFTNIFWNNTGKDVYEGKNGVLLSYFEELSNAPSETRGGIKTVNLVNDEIGEKILLDGTPLNSIAGAEIMYFGSSFLWIYAPNMSSYKELTIQPVNFFVANLPETHLAFFDTQWAESIKITSEVNGEEIITYCKKNSKTVIGEDFYTNLFTSENLSNKLVYFKVGNNVYTSNQTLEVNKDISVTAITVGFETTKGASIRMSSPSGIRFESKIDIREKYIAKYIRYLQLRFMKRIRITT